MALIFIQLSDIHLSCHHKNPILDRLRAISGAIRSVSNPGDNAILILSGDIACSGLPDEYILASKFINDLSSEIKEHLSTPVNTIVVSGNHDLDFELTDCDESIREMILDGRNPRNPPTDAMYKYCLSRQKSFWQFETNISDASTGVDLSIFHSISIDDLSIHIHLLNTSWCSRKTEVPGKLWYPLDVLNRNFDYARKSGINIAVLHHPYNWFIPENGRALSQLLESHCDIIFTGHDHVPEQYQKIHRTKEQNLYVEGGALQDHDDLQSSSFNVIVINTNALKYIYYSFTWDVSHYELLAEPSEHQFLRIRKPLKDEYEINKEWEIWLQEIGMDFSHPRSRDLTLNDLFIYPDLQLLDVRKACSAAGNVRDRDVLGFVQQKKRVLIAGHEKIGKTLFAKRLFIDLREAGYIPLLIRSDINIGKGGKLQATERIRESLNQECRRIYSEKSASLFWQSKIQQRAIIVDDFHRLPLSDAGRNEILEWLDQNFEIVIVLSAPGIRMTKILDSSQETIFWTFEHADILESDAESRYALIWKWLVAGTDSLLDSKEKLYREAVRYSQTIDGLVGQGTIPAIPMFVLMMMQQLETRGTVENTTGLYGSLYELIIRDVVKSASRDYSDLEVKLNYLTEFAYNLFLHRTNSVDEAAYVDWHKQYCNNYNVELNKESMMIQFEAIGIFRRNGNYIGFKYRYYCCFFLARYFANNIHDTKIINTVDHLCHILHNKDVANTLLFLCHLSKHPKILEMIRNSASKRFPDANEYDFLKSPRVFLEKMIRSSALMLPTTSPEEERLNTLRERDEIFRPAALIEEKDEADEMEVQKSISLINETNSAYNLIRICGQLVRNFYGSMRGETQVAIIRECYGLCLRMLFVLFDQLEKEKETIAQFLAAVIQHKYPDVSSDELNKRARKSLEFIALAISYGLIKHVSNSVGLAALKPTFDTLITGEDIGVSHRILDVSARLDYFDSFPEESILDILSKLKEGSIGYEILRVLVWEHFKLYRVDYRIRQRICSKLNIDASQAILLSGKEKRLLNDAQSKSI